MLNSTQSATGNENTQINGDHDTVSYNQTINYYSTADMCPHRLTHSYIHELLDIVNSSLPSENDEYSLQDPAQIHEKLRFNNALHHKMFIDEHAYDYAQVDRAMKDYPNSEDIVRRLRDLYLEVANRDEDGNLSIGDGNSQLRKIEEILRDTIIHDSKFDADKIHSETIDRFCIALTTYGISKCKILETPKERHAAS